MTNSSGLSGKRILVTRPKHQAEKLSKLLSDAGAMVFELALISIAAPKSWKEFDLAFKNIDEYQWIIFASANAVESTIERLKHLQALESLRKLKIACVGKSTAACLSEFDLAPNIVPQDFVAESLIDELKKHTPTGKALWPKTTKGRLLIKDDLEKFGWKVDIVHSYTTEGPEDPIACAKELANLVAQKKIDVVTLTSSETVLQLNAIAELCKTEFNISLSDLKLAVIGPETAKTCQTLFGRVDIQADEYSMRGLVESLIFHFA